MHRLAVRPTVAWSRHGYIVQDDQHAAGLATKHDAPPPPPPPPLPLPMPPPNSEFLSGRIGIRNRVAGLGCSIFRRLVVFLVS